MYYAKDQVKHELSLYLIKFKLTNFRVGQEKTINV